VNSFPPRGKEKNLSPSSFKSLNSSALEGEILARPESTELYKNNFHGFGISIDDLMIKIITWTMFLFAINISNKNYTLFKPNILRNKERSNASS